MEIIRVPTSYFTQLEYLPDKDFNYVMKTMFELCSGRNTKVEKSMRGGLVISIYREAIQMENKARAKKGDKRLEIDVATLTCDTVSREGCDQVTSSNITEHQVKSNNIVAATEVATLEKYIKSEFTTEFIREVYETYNLRKEDFQEECNSFLEYRKEKSPRGKKERWEKEKTFDPKLRFRTWMKNNDKWRKTVIINSEEDERKKKLAELEEKKKLLFNQK